MQSENLLNINLAKASEAAERLDIELTESFFADLEQDEISSGDVHAHILVRATAGNIYKVEIEVAGTVVVPCDRCLDPLSLPIEASDVIRIKDTAPSEYDDADILYLPSDSQCFDLSWQIYEIMVTALPIQRIHEDGSCNEDVTSFIAGVTDTEKEYEE